MRFASVYRKFDGVDQFVEEIKRIGQAMILSRENSSGCGLKTAS